MTTRPPCRKDASLPELPEVETVRRGLLPALEGRRIETALVRRPDLRWPLPEGMAARLEGRRVTALRRRSKYLLADLDSGETLIVHLGMTGRFLVEDRTLVRFVHGNGPLEKHDHVVLDIEGGARVRFNDARRFGAMDLWPSADLERHWLLAGIGPEPFGPEFDGAYLARKLVGRRTSIKAALLDQRTVAGLGNIYVSEALHRARLSPKRLAGRIAQARAAALVPIVRAVLAEAIEAGGSSLRDYRGADGALGLFQHRFRVYGRDGLACVTEGCSGTVRRIVQSGRSSFYCATCQR